MITRRFFLAVFSLFCLLSGQAFANDKLTVLLDWFVNPDHGPIIIAQENGYFSACPAATSFGGADGSAGATISTSSPTSAKYPFSCAMIIGP